MSHPLESIYALQKKDRKLIKMMREIRDIPQRKSDIEAQLAGTLEKLEAAVESRKRSEAALKEIELEIESLKERIVKYKNQQMEAQTNDQYRAFVKEIGGVEAEIGQLEDREIELMEQLEQEKAVVQEHQQTLDSEKAGIAGELDALNARSAELMERMEKAKADRARAAEQCDATILQKYTRIMNNKKDFAVVMVESGSHCGGCHMKLPPQVTNDARNPGKIVSCNFCGRIVYNPPM